MPGMDSMTGQGRNIQKIYKRSEISFKQGGVDGLRPDSKQR
jgi:hypothetical protein